MATEAYSGISLIPGTVVTKDGIDYYVSYDGRLRPPIAGGRDDDPAAGRRRDASGDRGRRDSGDRGRVRDDGDRGRVDDRGSDRGDRGRVDDGDPERDPEGGDPEGDPDAARYSQRDFDRHMAGMRRGFEKELRRVDTRFDEMQTNFQQLMGALEEAVGSDEDPEDADPEGGEGDPDDPERREPAPRAARRGNTAESEEIARLKSAMRKMETNQKELIKRVETEREAREQEVLKRLETERDSLITEALTEAKAVSIPGGLRFFRETLEYDPEKERFYYIEEGTGAKLDVKEGIRDAMPDWLKASQAKQGGAGGRGSAQAQALATEQNRLEELKAKAHKEPNDANVTAYQTAKKAFDAAQGIQTKRPGGMGAQTRQTPAEAGAATE